ncbi:hydrogenase 3 membrane subunit, partial [Escherichia coli]
MPSKEITMRQTLCDGYLVIFALAQAVILLMLTPL